MSASYEWTEYHLTTSGWVTGTEKTDFDRSDVTPPSDRVLSVRYIEEHTGYGGGSRHQETWRSQDTDQINALLAIHGDPPAHL
ncbi:conserved hypothetical protein [Cupriavidus taiwanensis]|jgi:hypothetical protein|nr:conserved hypothetical protein [Cupriavidus taiwanensis]